MNGRKWKVRGLLVAASAVAGMTAFAPQASAFVASSTVLTASPNPATVGQTVVLTATVTCPGFTPEGGLGVTFFDNADLLATVPVAANGQAVYNTTFATAGSHDITAAYNGNENCGASNDVLTIAVSSTTVPPAPPCGCGGLIGIVTGGLNVGGGSNQTVVGDNNQVNG